MRSMDLASFSVSSPVSTGVSDLLDGDLQGSQTSYLVVDYLGRKIIRVTTPGGVYTTVAGSTASILGTADGIGTSATFDTPITITVWRCGLQAMAS